MAETVLAKMAVQIAANTAEFSKGLNQATNQFSSFTKGVQSAAGAIGVSFGAAAILGGLKDAVDVMASFEKKMSEVRAITGATGEEFQLLRNNALDLGRATLYSADQVAELQIAYGRLGFTTREIVAATKATIDLATATGEDLGKSADIVGSTIRAFGLAATDTQKVTDIMASSFNKTALGLDNFGEAIKYVAPIAAQANISLEETTAMLGTLADAGIRGSSAGTALRKIITDLGKESGTLSEKLQKLADKGLTGAQALDEVGRTAYASLLILTKATEKTKDLTDAFHNATGETERMAAVMSDNLSGDVTKLTNSWNGLLAALGETAPFRYAAQGLTSLIKVIQGLPDERLLFEGLAASITTGFNLDKAIANVAAFRKELGKPIDIASFDTIIKKYNLTDEEVNKLKAALDEVNKSLSDQEKTIKNFTQFASEKEISDISTAVKEYTRNIDVLILKEEDLAKANRELKTGDAKQDKFFEDQALHSERLVEQYLKMIAVINEYTAAATAAGKVDPLGETPKGIIETLEEQIKDFRKLQRESFSVDEIKNYGIEIEKLTKYMNALLSTVSLKFDVEAFGKSFGDLEEQNKKFNDQVHDGHPIFQRLKDDMEQVQEEAYKVGMSLMSAKEPFLDWEPQYREIKRIQDIMKSLGDTINQLIAGAIADLSFALGEGLAGGSNFGKDLLRAAVSFAKQLSAVFISTGIAIEAFKTASESGDGYLLIAAGIALGLAAGIASATLKSGANGLGHSSSPAPARNTNTFGSLNSTGNEITLRGEWTIKGNDLLYVINRQTQLNGRIRG